MGHRARAEDARRGPCRAAEGIRRRARSAPTGSARVGWKTDRQAPVVRRVGPTVRPWRDWPSIARAVVVVVAVKVCLRVAPMRLIRVAARGTGAASPHALML